MRQFEGESPEWTEAYLEAAASATVLVDDTSMSISECAEASAAYCEAFADATVARLQARREAREKAETERREAEKARLQKSWLMFQNRLWRVVGFHGDRVEFAMLRDSTHRYCNFGDAVDWYVSATEDQVRGFVAKQLSCDSRDRVTLVWDDDREVGTPPYILDVRVDGKQVTAEQWVILVKSGLVPVHDGERLQVPDGSAGS